MGEVLATNATGQEFIAYVLIGNGCDCRETEVYETTTLAETVDAEENVETNEFEDIQDKRFGEVLSEVRESYSRLLGMFFLSLSREIVVYYNGVTAGLMERFKSFEDAANTITDELGDFVQRTEGSLSRSYLKEEDFENYQNKTVAELKAKLLGLKMAFNSELSSTSERFENILEDLIPLFEKLENYCKLVTYSSKTPVLAKKVAEEFMDEYFGFEETLRNQVDLAIESEKELELHYNSLHSELTLRMLSGLMETNFTNVDSKFIHYWKRGYTAQLILTMDAFKNEDLDEEIKNLKEVLRSSLATVFADINLLTDCVKNSSLPIYETITVRKKLIWQLKNL